ncbi:MAG: hypothetical protein AVDCRST_MAG11-173, partial [uncultured Gemmatimonadaceae bacterium]
DLRPRRGSHPAGDAARGLPPRGACLGGAGGGSAGRGSLLRRGAGVPCEACRSRQGPGLGHQRAGAGVEADAAGRLRVAAGDGRRRAPIGGAVRGAVRRARLDAPRGRADDSQAERGGV